MIPPVPPGIRETDPDAEAARLAEARKRPLDAALLVDEVHHVNLVAMHIVVTAEKHVPVPSDLGTKLANVLRSTL